MTVDGREDLYNYSYLTANKYLDKFRAALSMPELSISTLHALLKAFNNKLHLVNFIVKNRQGKPILYYKQTLNKILGMTNDGHFYTDPKHNPNLDMLNDILEYWEQNAEEKEKERALVAQPEDYSSDEEDMQKVSDKLIHDDSFGEVDESKKPRKIHITESQLNTIKNYLSEQYFVETEKVKIVKNFLDDNFIRGALPSVGEDGYGKAVGIVTMKIPYSEEGKNMTAAQAFYLLQDKFNKIYSDPKQRDNFLKKILVDWYYKRISPEGLLSKNSY